MSFSKFLPAGAAALGLFASNAAFAADLVTYEPVIESAVSEPGDWYVSLFAGGTLTSDIDTFLFVNGALYDATVFSIDPGYSLGVAVGTSVYENLRIEAELSAGKSETLDGTFQNTTTLIDGPLHTAYLMGNLWYDFDTGSGFTPYIGGGIGVGYASADMTVNGNPAALGDGGFGFAYQLGAGVAIDVADNLSLDLGYRFKALSNIDFSDNGNPTFSYPETDIYSHTVQAGLRFSF